MKPDACILQNGKLRIFIASHYLDLTLDEARKLADKITENIAALESGEGAQA